MLTSGKCKICNEKDMVAAVDNFHRLYVNVIMRIAILLRL